MTTLNDLTDYDTQLQPNAVDIRTEYLEPITSSTYRHTFRLDQTGYLDTNSMLVFKLQAVGGDNDNKCRVNNWNGALGGIKRVIFQIGDNIINDVQDVYKYATMKNMNMQPQMRNNYLGHYLGNQLWLDTQKSANDDPNEFAAETTSSYADANGTRTGAVVVNHKRSGTDFGALGDGANFCINSHRIGTDASTNHQYGIPLGMLIPALKGQKIPLFLFDKQRILLTFEFNTADKYCNNLKAAKINYTTGGVNTALCNTADVIPVDVRMVVDYIVMPTDVQNELIQQTMQQGGYKLEFYDVVNVEKNVVSGTNGQIQEIEHRIGQNNREVHNIIMWKETSHNALTRSDSNTKGGALFGQYQKCQGFGREEYNCNIDGRDEFDHFVYNPISQYNELSAVLGNDYQVSRPMYCNDDNTSCSALTSLGAGLLGVQKPLALNLRNGEPVVVGGGRQIGNYPIIWKWKRDCHSDVINDNQRDDQNVKVNYFCEVSRVANIMSTGKGTNVVVSY